MIRLAALACGLICGIGLLVSGLFRPSSAQGFLDVAGAWDPAFGLGLGVTMVLAVPGFRMARALGRPVLGGMAEAPPVAVDGRLIAGSLLFGFGWGIAGYFPAAAVVAAGLFSPGAALFLAAVLGGMLLHDLVAGGGRLRIEGMRSRG